MDARAAADAIRADIDPHVAAKVKPDDRRKLAFLQSVASHLGLDHTNHFVLWHVGNALSHHEIEAPTAEQYPKWVELHPTHLDHDLDGHPILPPWVREFHRQGDKMTIIAADADEEKRAVELKQDAAVEDALSAEQARLAEAAERDAKEAAAKAAAAAAAGTAS